MCVREVCSVFYTAIRCIVVDLFEREHPRRRRLLGVMLFYSIRGRLNYTRDTFYVGAGRNRRRHNTAFCHTLLRLISPQSRRTPLLSRCRLFKCICGCLPACVRVYICTQLLLNSPLCIIPSWALRFQFAGAQRRHIFKTRFSERLFFVRNI